MSKIAKNWTLFFNCQKIGKNLINKKIPKIIIGIGNSLQKRQFLAIFF